jgi:hypothetical protein|uniref:Uncharacterized protein n=1 Tax=Eutreptiella gymnastica TaxID=73025 RepID=A0A7S4LEW9_9EUGL
MGRSRDHQYRPAPHISLLLHQRFLTYSVPVEAAGAASHSVEVGLNNVTDVLESERLGLRLREKHWVPLARRRPREHKGRDGAGCGRGRVSSPQPQELTEDGEGQIRGAQTGAPTTGLAGAFGGADETC